MLHNYKMLCQTYSDALYMDAIISILIHYENLNAPKYNLYFHEPFKMASIISIH